MSLQSAMENDPKVNTALDELRDLIRRQYPDAAFQVTSASDDPAIIHLIAEVDVDDTEPLVDLVIDRMISLQVDDGLPIFVIPQRTAQRVAARRHAR